MAPLSGQEYLDEMAQAEKDKTEYMKKAAFTIDENNVTLAESAEDLAEGKGIFKQYCAACHGQLGEGKVGPNFTDKFWLHGGSINDLFKTIKYGVPEKGMISWQSQLNPRQMREVASYILTLQGTNPPNQKEAQGVEYIPAGAAPVDSTAVPVDSLSQTKP
jgi:cytochrome c oxidase cbb3-type subunit 3